MSTRFIAGSDASVLVDTGLDPSPAATAAVLALFRALRASSPPWLRDLKPAYASLLVEFDPRVIDHDDVIAAMSRVAAGLVEGVAASTSRQHTIDVIYDGADLDFVAAQSALSRDDVVALHSGRDYTVAFLGFMPGFAYLLGLDPRLAIPRRASPRASVPAGSVAVAGDQTAIYPSSSPGGWHLIGRVAPPRRSAARPSPGGAHPQLAPDWCAPGDRVRFVRAGAVASTARAFSASADDGSDDDDSASASADTASADTADTASADTAPAPLLEAGVDVAGVTFVKRGITAVVVGPRLGRAHLGFSQGGAADMRAFAFANAAVGNAADAPALECTMQGPTMRADTDVDVCVAGAAVPVDVDGVAQPMWRAFRLHSGQTLRIGTCTRGARAYVAMHGGGATDVGRDPASSRIDDRGAIDATSAAADYARLDDVTLRATDGTHASAAVLEGCAFAVSSASDRRGVRLVPEAARAHELANAGGDVVSEGVSLGTVQLPSSGGPIVLGVDRTSTGGYRKVASVISADLWMLGQLRPGARVRFARVTLAEARAALRRS